MSPPDPGPAPRCRAGGALHADLTVARLATGTGYLGYFDDEESAARAVDAAALVKALGTAVTARPCDVSPWSTAVVTAAIVH